MTTDRLLFIYMAIAGALAGAVLVAAPEMQNFVIKPYFWIVIAIVLFDGGVYLLRKNAPGTMISMSARLLGFVIGVVLMVSIATLAQAPIKFF